MLTSVIHLKMRDFVTLRHLGVSWAALFLALRAPGVAVPGFEEPLLARLWVGLGSGGGGGIFYPSQHGGPGEASLGFT